MKRLLALRHAKSSWDNPDLPDKERPLNARGDRAAHLIGAYLRQAGLVPDFVLCSTALRTRQTLDRLTPSIGGDIPVEFLPSLYLASSDTIAEDVRRLADDIGTVLLIGHNPGLQEAVLAMIGEGDAGDIDQIASKFPTGALAVIDFDIHEWNDLETGLLVDFRKPKTLV